MIFPNSNGICDDFQTYVCFTLVINFGWKNVIKDSLH